MNIPTCIEWPSTLPLPFIDFSGEVRNATVSSSPNLGFIYRRSRFKKEHITARVSWVFGIAEYDAFQVFFLNALGNGSAFFKMELRYPTNSALVFWVVQFVGGYNVSYVDGSWSVDAGLNLIGKTALPELANIV